MPVQTYQLQNHLIWPTTKATTKHSQKTTALHCKNRLSTTNRGQQQPKEVYSQGKQPTARARTVGTVVTKPYVKSQQKVNEKATEKLHKNVG